MVSLEQYATLKNEFFLLQNQNYDLTAQNNRLLKEIDNMKASSQVKEAGSTFLSATNKLFRIRKWHAREPSSDLAKPPDKNSNDQMHVDSSSQKVGNDQQAAEVSSHSAENHKTTATPQNVDAELTGKLQPNGDMVDKPQFLKNYHDPLLLSSLAALDRIRQLIAPILELVKPQIDQLPQEDHGDVASGGRTSCGPVLKSQLDQNKIDEIHRGVKVADDIILQLTSEQQQALKDYVQSSDVNLMSAFGNGDGSMPQPDSGPHTSIRDFQTFFTKFSISLNDVLQLIKPQFTDGSDSLSTQTVISKLEGLAEQLDQFNGKGFLASQTVGDVCVASQKVPSGEFLDQLMQQHQAALDARDSKIIQLTGKADELERMFTVSERKSKEWEEESKKFADTIKGLSDEKEQIEVQNSQLLLTISKKDQALLSMESRYEEEKAVLLRRVETTKECQECIRNAEKMQSMQTELERVKQSQRELSNLKEPLEAKMVELERTREDLESQRAEFQGKYDLVERLLHRSKMDYRSLESRKNTQISQLEQRCEGLLSERKTAFYLQSLARDFMVEEVECLLREVYQLLYGTKLRILSLLNRILRLETDNAEKTQQLEVLVKTSQKKRRDMRRLMSTVKDSQQHLPSGSDEKSVYSNVSQSVSMRSHQNQERTANSDIHSLIEKVTALQQEKCDLTERSAALQKNLNITMLQLQTKNALILKCFGSLDKSVITSKFDANVIAKIIQRNPNSSVDVFSQLVSYIEDLTQQINQH